MGRKKRPFYRIVAADQRSPRDGRFIEKIGYYDPLLNPHEIKLDEERIHYWLDKGAQPSRTVRNLLQQKGVLHQIELKKRGLSEEDIEIEMKRWQLLQDERRKRQEAAKSKKKKEKTEKDSEDAAEVVETIKEKAEEKSEPEEVKEKIEVKEEVKAEEKSEPEEVKEKIEAKAEDKETIKDTEDNQKAEPDAESKEKEESKS